MRLVQSLMFDNVCKFLAENYSTNFANWLIGKDINFTRLEPSELSLEPIRADAIILLQSEKEIALLNRERFILSPMWVTIGRVFDK